MSQCFSEVFRESLERLPRLSGRTDCPTDVSCDELAVLTLKAYSSCALVHMSKSEDISGLLVAATKMQQHSAFPSINLEAGHHTQ